MQLARWEPRCTRTGKLAANSNVERLNNWWIVAPTRRTIDNTTKICNTCSTGKIDKRPPTLRILLRCIFIFYILVTSKNIFLSFFFIWIYSFLIFRIFLYFGRVNLEMNQFIINVTMRWGEELVNFLRDRSNFLIERNPLIILNGNRRDVESDVIHQGTYFRVD